MRRYLLLPALLPIAAVAQSPTYARERARIDSLVTAEVASTPMAGISVAVVKGRDTVVMRAWGFADLENGVAEP